MRTRTKWIVSSLSVLALAAAAAAGLRPDPLPVEAAEVTRGPLSVQVEGRGRARVRERYVVAAPVGGHLARIALRPGDPVVAGQTIAAIAPAAAPLLDGRARAEAEARVAASRAALAEARAALARARLERDQAGRELERARRLAAGGAAPGQALEAAEFEARLGDHGVEAARLAVETSERGVAAALATLGATPAGGAGERGPARVEVVAPATGTVLRLLAEHEGPVAAGAPLVDIGDPASLEAVIEVLSVDAVRVRPGARATIEGWGDRALAGVVERVEPSAFTKVSALGVEEQRVNVVVQPRPADAGWRSLGDGYHVEARIVVWEGADVVRVPVAALFRHREAWAVFVVRGDRVERRAIELGARGASEAEVVRGAVAGERVVLHPGDRLADGARVRPSLEHRQPHVPVALAHGGVEPALVAGEDEAHHLRAGREQR